MGFHEFVNIITNNRLIGDFCFFTTLLEMPCRQVTRPLTFLSPFDNMKI